MRCDWLLGTSTTTNVEFARTLYATNVFERAFIGNKSLTDSIFESARRLLSWSEQQKTNVLASLRPAYIRQLLGVSRQIIRLLGVSRLMYVRQALFYFFPAIWDTICRSICHVKFFFSWPLVHMPCFFPSLIVVSLSQLSLIFTDCISPCIESLPLWAQALPFHFVLDSIIYFIRAWDRQLKICKKKKNSLNKK